MKILTYNIWNSEINFMYRLNLLCKLLSEVNADIIALQEVKNKETLDYIKTQCKYTYHVWKKSCDDEEGLAILSKYPFTFIETDWPKGDDMNNSYVLRAVVECNNKKIGITNIHLDYKSVLNRENFIVNTVKVISAYSESDYELLLGDLNSYPDSSIYRYLTGMQSLNNNDTSWIDLHKNFEIRRGDFPRATLDFIKNPRWDKEVTLEEPGRFDYIMLKSPYPKKSPVLKSVEIIGDTRENNITPSDHYGVMSIIYFT